MKIYVMYKDGAVTLVTFMPKHVHTQFAKGAEYMDVWDKEKHVNRLTSAKAFNRYMNPQREVEDEENGGSGYDW